MDIETRKRTRRGLAVLALAAVTAAAGCVDTELSGVILDDDIFDPDLMLPMVKGINSELTDNYRDFFDGVPFMLGAPTDDFTNDGVASTEEQVSAGDLRDREFGDFLWEQLHEAAWAGYKGVETLGIVFGEAEASRRAETAQAWFVSGIAERFLGEMFCEQVYNYGPGAGPLLSGDASIYDSSHPVPRDSAFVRSLNAFQNALEVAEAAVAAGEGNPDGSNPIFEPQNLVYKAHAGIAQAAANLGRWDLAVQHATQVPDDFVAYSHHHQEGVGEPNSMWQMFYTNDDVTMWNTPMANQWPDDPRHPWTPCGEFRSGPKNTSGGSIDRLGCSHPSNEYRAESNTIPMYRSDKFTDSDDDMPLVKGAEMRLIRAEAALRAGDLGGFTTQVNAARAIYGIDPIDAPATAGALEFPNAEDDAWSILDRERYLTLNLEGRRLWDLERWDHPWFDANYAMTDRLYEDYGTDLPRWSCYPIADIECDANTDLACPNLAGT